ncbi:MarR family winged helix-turn-helix transcriptional regulator [Pimelobacter simplex]|uniref:MarR family winged helix-turn-helix transcriptional regulator n=1 Tax=Nocardioides simplex TaxID=2045 RepID=UPI001C05A011|nr:MarR family transcriptional regulator [Pimelobacter sp. 30-1]
MGPVSTTTRWLDDEETLAWRAWVDLNAQLSARLNRELQAASGLSLSDYEILVALTDQDVPDRSLRMFELGERLQWEKSRVSKQVSRMEARGLVERRHCADDRRGAFVDLTDAGLAAISAAAPGHVALVRELFFEGLSGDQVRSLGRFATTVLERLAAES